MRRTFKLMQALVMIGQVGLSIAAPLVIMVSGAVWLHRHLDWPGWIVVVGVFLGIFGAVSCLYGALKSLNRIPKEDDPEDQGYNDHD